MRTWHRWCHECYHRKLLLISIFLKKGHSVYPHFLFVFPEPAVWKPAEKVQEQQRLAKTLGGVHQLQPLLLQVTPGVLSRKDMYMYFGRSLITEASLSLPAG